MSWLASIFVALLTGVLGLFLAGFIAAACVEWYHISKFEGGAGYFMIITAILGGLLSFFIGLVGSRVVATMAAPGFFKGLGLSFAVILLIAGVATLVAWLRADIPPKIAGQELNLEVELRLPVGATNPPVSLTNNSSFTLGSTINHVQRKSRKGELELSAARRENGRWIIPASAFLFTQRGLRSISVELDGKSVGGFIVPLPARPGPRFEEWSDWGPRVRSANEPWPDTNSSYRFRVQRIQPPPPPGPTAEEYEAKEAAEEQAKFEALGVGTPIQEWFPYVRYGAPEARRTIAIQHLTARPNFVVELSALMVDADDEIAKESLYLIAYLPPPQSPLLAPVAAAGRHIAEMIRKVNVASVEQNPSYLGAASVSVRFSAWMEAVRTLREKSGGDFTPELRTILELSRVRTDSIIMRGDVRRVASYYMKQWANLDPLPDDPPPR